VVPIPGTKRRKYVEENARACDIQLSEKDLQRLEGVGVAAGTRYPEQGMKAVNR